MSSTYSPILRSELIGAGDQAGTWGNTTNSNFQYVFESAIAGYVAVTVSPTANNQVLTYVNGPSASSALDQSIYALIKLNTGTLGANFNIFCPPVSKTYVVWNNTSYTASFYNSTVIGNTTPGGSAAVIPAGAKVTIWSDGFSFYTANDTTIGNYTVTGNETVVGNLAIGGTSNFTGAAVFGSPVTFSNSAAFAVGPTAPTAAPGTSTSQLATTAFVQNVAGSLGTMSSQNANNVNITGGVISGLSSLGTSGTVTAGSFSGSGAGLTGTAGSLNIGGNAGSASSVAWGNVTGRPYPTTSNWQYSGQGGQPSWLWGTNDGSNMYVWNPANFSVNYSNSSNYANSAGYAGTAGNANAVFGKSQLGLGITGEYWQDVTGARAQGVAYYAPGYPIQVSGNFGCNGGGQGQIYINGTLVSFWQAQFNGCGGYSVNMPCIVPPGQQYILAAMGGGARGWYELR